MPKADFQAVLERLGYHDVEVYINSGNAIFTSETPPKASDVQLALEKHFGFTIPALVLSSEKLQEIVEAIPADWTNDVLKPDKSGQKSDVLYLFDEVNSPDIIEKLGYRPEIETMLYTDRAVLTTITRKNQTKGSLQKVVGTKLYASMTVRNVNTARKLAELAK